MKSYFVYRNTTSNVLDCFSMNGFENIKEDRLPDILRNRAKLTVVYNTDLMNCKKQIRHINILFLDKPLISSKDIESFDYILPSTPPLYFTSVKNYKYKVLLPLNINGDEFWDRYYCHDLTHRKYKMSLRGAVRGTISDSGFALYNDINELDGKNCYGKAIYRLNSKCLPPVLSDITNYLRIASKFCNFNRFKYPDDNINCNIIYFSSITDKLSLKDHEIYIITRKGFKIYDTINYKALADNYTLNGFNCVSFIANGMTDNELCIMYRPFNDENISYNQLVSRIEFHDARFIGYNDNDLTDDDVYKYYKIYGSKKMYHMYEHLQDFNDMYYDLLARYIRGVNIVQNQKCNADKFLRVMSFWAGLNDYDIDVIDYRQFVKKNPQYFQQKKILLLSKAIINYGGNQKTALQLYKELIIEGYDVSVGHLGNEDLVNKIDRLDIIKFNGINDIATKVNESQYEYIIVNKLNEFSHIAKDIKTKSIFITHNSMDPVNSQIIKESKFFNKIFTVNNFHISTLYDEGANTVVTKYLNYENTDITPVKPRTKLKNNITFIGRLSNEKNIELILEAFNYVKSIDSFKNYTLTMIGDGRMKMSKDLINKCAGVRFIGRCNHDEITYNLINTDFLIMASSTEGLPYVFLEALSIGIPIITSNIIGCDEIIQDEENGFTFEFEDYNENKLTAKNWAIFKIVDKKRKQNIDNMVEGIIKALSLNVDEWNNMSRRCIEWYKSHYNIKKMIRENMRNIVNGNKVAIVCGDCDSGFIKLFQNITIASHIPKSEMNNYDIVINPGSFDMFCGRLSLLRNEKFKEHDRLSMNKALSRLYKLRQEMLEEGYNRIIDMDGNSIYINNITNVNAINKFYVKSISKYI